MPFSTSPRSSITVIDPEQTKTSDDAHSPLEQEIARDENNFEHYGGDDIHEPSRVELSPAPTVDENMVTWDGPNDQKNPQNWSKARKWGITLVCMIMTLNVTFASSAPTSATGDIIKAFGITKEVSYLLTTMFLLGYVFGPLFWGPGSELVGRRPIFIGTMAMYTIFHLGQALARNIETLLVTRFLSGFFAVAPLTNCGGVIADIWPAVGRGPATSLFTAAVFLGPVLGPIASGFIVESPLSWRWVFWIMMIFAGACTILVTVALPETYAPIILLKKVKQIRKANPEASRGLYAEHEKQDWSVKGVLHRTIFRPFYMLYKEPILVLVTIYLSLVYGILYALFEEFPIIFIERRGFTIAQSGLMFIGIGIGTTLGSVINVFATAHYPALIQKWKGFPPPEQRLFSAMIGSVCLVTGIFWLGWSGQYASVPWYVPGLATIVLGASISLIYMSFLSYLVDTYLMYSASAFAANTMVRSAVGAAFPLFTVQMFTKLGLNWGSTLLGLVALLLSPSPFLFYKYGARIRMGSTFAPCIDLRIAKELEEEEKKGRV